MIETVPGRRVLTHLTSLLLTALLWQQAQCQGCPTDWQLLGDSCYSVFTPKQAFENAYKARERCLQEHADMATIDDATTENFIFSLILNQSDTAPLYAYIGLTDLEEEGNFTWLDGSIPAYINFSDGQPSNHNILNGEHCVVIESPDRLWGGGEQTGWHDVPCCFPAGSHNSVVCQKPLDRNITVAAENNTIYSYCFGNCPSNWYKFNGTCFSLLDPATVPYNSTVYARDVCLRENADLPSVVSADVSTHIHSILQTKQAGPIYLAANDVKEEGTYKHLENTAVVYTNWSAGVAPQLNNSVNCVSMASDQIWEDISCCSDEGVTWVMCEKPEMDDYSDYSVSRDNNVFAQDCFEHINECDSNPCQNGGTCEDHVMYFECLCVAGYEGDMCETKIDFCASNPCQNNAPCEPLLNAYICNCTAGYNGSECQEMYDHCLATEPCKHGSTCENLGTNSTCTCPDGFTGFRCETNIDDCERLNITCVNGGKCVDDITTAACDCPTGFNGASCENNITCPTNLLGVENATEVNNTGVEYGAIVRYDCLPGHKFPDMDRSKTLVCLEEGWTEDKALAQLPLKPCEPHCDFLPEVAFSEVGNNNTKVGQVVNYTCTEGFKLADNSTGFNITCLESGNWSLPLGEVPQCEIVTCPELPEYSHQTLHTKNNTYNTTVVFSCDVGYVLHDNTTARTIKCLKDGDWTATLPPCLPVQCPVIGELDNLNRNTSEHIYNTYAKFTCDNGLRMMDGATFRVIKCDATAEWSDQVTDCSNDRCFPLPYVANATPSDTLAIHGHEVELSCIPGHRFFLSNGKVKERTMKCEVTSRWSPLLSSCEPVYCDEVPGNINSEPNTTNTLFGTVVDIHCLKGHYYPNGTDSVITQCQDDEKWNIDAVDPCWPIVCPDPPGITNGSMIEEPSNYNFSQEVVYECDDEFKFIDGNKKRTITCNEFGDWDLTDVSCRKERCQPVPSGFKAVPDTTNTSWFSVVVYQCDTGYHWDDRLTYAIECTNNGVWNETDNVPNCLINECPDVPQLLNATVNDTAHVYDTYIAYTCDDGFKYSETNDKVKTRWCSPDEIWEPEEFPSCDIIHCPELPDIENATKSSNETEYLTEVTYNCEPGYQFPDKDRLKIVTCTANETWTDLQFTFCEVVFCPPVPYWDANFNSTDNEFHAVVEYSCKDGNAFEDSNKDVNMRKKSTCVEAKVWEPPLASCVPLESIAKDLEGVVYESEEAVPIGTIACTLMCLLLAAIILLDLHKLMQDLKMMKRNIQSMLEDRNNKVSDSSQDIKQAAESVA